MVDDIDVESGEYITRSALILNLECYNVLWQKLKYDQALNLFFSSNLRSLL